MNQLDNDTPFENIEDELFYTIAFSMLTGLSERQKLKILHYYQSATNVFNYRKHNQADWPLQAAEKEMKFIAQNAIQCFSVLNPYYPNRLAQIADPPIALYVKGSAHFNLPQLISVIGTRQHTHQVQKVVQELLAGLTHLKLGVISGMALGVDGIAHKTALELKIPTWGVMAHGLDQIYPNQHRTLAFNMLSNGGLMTECKHNTPTMTFQFPKRNRIVAGMSDATIVIESAMEGGSMITAKLARAYDREVFAVPGKIHDPKSKGCLWLIKNNIASLYYDPIELLENMNWPTPPIIKSNTINSLPLDPIAKSIYLLIQKQGPLHKDIIALSLGIETGDLAMHLLNLELKGYIYLQAGNVYSCS